MTGQVFDQGSIIGFKSERFTATYTPVACDPIEHQCFGWGIRVVSREGWVVVTEVVAMVGDGKGGLKPLCEVTNAPGVFHLEA